MNIDRIVLTKDEAGWFSRNIPKMLDILEKSERRNKGVTERQTYKILSSMQDVAKDMASALTAFGEEPFEIEVNLSRKQKGIVSGILTTVISNLEDRIIPAYKSKLGATEGIDYQSYIEKAENKGKMLKSMKRKFK